ncbi:acetyl-CoA hydrolase/transferase family protein [Acetobacterium malicum]|uniref:acetyl-CoA hydrolase/transferase family protein n=1 Tax=Acetobacterium malicum TaxID=52692 RepID=UPI00040CA83D|nr:acetyl-CoA hydrolase/transferase C-terminal domain-containing protein [Acetobacterium dehalogenans]
MNWQDDYKCKLISVDEAASKIEDGDRAWISPCSASPIQLVDAICDRYKELTDVHMTTALAMYPFKFMTSPDYIGHINYHTAFYGPYDRAYEKAGNVELYSVQFQNFGKLILDQSKEGPRINTVLAEVSLPDEDGYLYFGPMGVSVTGPVCEIADKVIVQVNKHQPKVFGTYNKIHVNDVTWICEYDHQLPEFPQPPISETDQKIANVILDEIPDGACIQIGLGGLANAIGYGLESKKDLSVHTEMFTDSMYDLCKKGVISGRIYCGFGLGSQELYEFVGRGNVELAPIWIVNDSYAVGKNDNFISINACLMADLTGQVCSEGIGHRKYSGVGGQVDYVRGAAISKGGKSFLCLASVSKDKNGTLRSNIMCDFAPGQIVTTPRSDVMYIVTEFGIADLYNKSIPDRVEAMIQIAHPDFRDDLREKARHAKLIK